MYVCMYVGGVDDVCMYGMMYVCMYVWDVDDVCMYVCMYVGIGEAVLK